jgi:hypothetical protein
MRHDAAFAKAGFAEGKDSEVGEFMAAFQKCRFGI